MMSDRKTFIQKGLWSAAGTAGLLTAMQKRDRDIYADLGVVNVKAFGAMGDGIQDDRPAIQKAVDSLRKTGGTVYFPAGVYALSKDPETDAGVQFYSNMKLAGAGRGNTILRWRDDVGTDSYYHFVLGGVEGGVNNVTLTGFEVDGNKSARTRERFDAGGEGINIDGTNTVIYDLYIHDVLGEGMDCDNTESMLISNVIVENTGGNGIHCSDPSVRNVLISNTFTRNCAHGRKEAGNVRYGGLCLRGSGIYVSNHRSVDDAQIATLEGQGLGPDNEIHLHQVTGKSDSNSAEGFRIGMEGKVTLTACRTELAGSSSRSYYTDNFTGEVTLRDCYAEHGSGVPYHFAMQGSLKLDGCIAKSRTPDSRSENFFISVEGQVSMSRCEVVSKQSRHRAIVINRATQGLSLEGCRVVNPENIEGHALHVQRFEPGLQTPVPVTLHGGTYQKGNTGGAAVRIEGPASAAIQMRDLESCTGGEAALEVGFSEEQAGQEFFASGNRLDGEPVSLAVHQSVQSGFIGNNFCHGAVELSGSGLAVTGNRMRSLRNEGNGNREEGNLML